MILYEYDASYKQYSLRYNIKIYYRNIQKVNFIRISSSDDNKVRRFTKRIVTSSAAECCLFTIRKFDMDFYSVSPVSV